MSDPLLPKFRRFENHNGPCTLCLGDSVEARKFKEEKKKHSSHPGLCQPPNRVRSSALAAVRRLGGDSKNDQHVLGQHELQFGIFRGKTFLWMLNNALGYAGYIINKMKMEQEKETTASLSVNKFCLKRYVESFPEGKEVVSVKEMEARSSRRPSSAAASTSKRPATFTSAMAAQLVKRNLPPAVVTHKMDRFMAKYSRSKASSTAPPPSSTVPPPSAVPPSTVELTPATEEELCDADLLAAVEGIEATKKSGSSACKASQQLPAAVRPTTAPSGEDADYPLLKGWRESLPEVDCRWVSKALFKWSASAKPEVDYDKIGKLWWYPPEPALVCSQAPRVDRYFAHKLFLWMPRKLWKYRLFCPHATCKRHELTSAGVYPVVRHVLDIDQYYNMATEYLECSRCKRKVIAWSSVILSQLDVGHRSQFPAILTYHYACDMRVIRMLRNRGLGNGPFKLCKTLSEQHNEIWLQRCIQYYTECRSVAAASSSRLVTVVTFKEPPSQPEVPKYKWLLNVYSQDVLQRLDEVKAAITSTFGRVLKLDSTKKVAKKLSGHGARTAEWATNVGNEHGQVLLSVLTAKEGCALQAMAQGLMDRYSAANVDQPELIYVDRDCCSGHIKQLFNRWQGLHIRLDVWHFMRRIASGCTTDAHQLYKLFMGRLSQCIFHWDQHDLDALKNAKRGEMRGKGISSPTDRDIINSTTRRELALHCRRTTRSAEDIKVLIQQLLEAFDSEQGRDTLGVPLLNTDRIWEEWDKAKTHVACLQDPVGVQLYTEVGTLTKGGVELKMYRCARGSVSLESFHLHLNRFIPGTSANDLHFQAYLLDGLVRWNQDRAQAAVVRDDRGPESYSSLLHHAANDLCQAVMGKPLVPGFQKPKKYTGELIGVEYLYNQTGKALPDIASDPEKDGIHAAEDDDDDEGFGEAEEEVDDLTVADAEVILPVPSSATIATVRQRKDSTHSTLSSVCQRNRPSRKESQLQDPFPGSQAQPGTLEIGASCSSHSVATVSNTPSPGPSTSSPVLNPDECVGPDNIPGFEHVHNLAGHLVSLREQTTPLTNQQAEDIIQLWLQLSEYDRRPTVFDPRYPSKPKGRFGNSKTKTVVAPGAETTKRCFLGQNTGPAHYPDCNRYMETVISRLCEIHPSNIKVARKTVLRWTCVLRSYKHIRHLVISHPRIMTETGIQLVEINATTLSTWFDRRSKKEERLVLEQGITVPQPSMAATQSLPPATTRPPALPSGDAAEGHSFRLPEDESGKATVKRRPKQPQQSQTPATVPTLLPNVSFLVLPPATTLTGPTPSCSSFSAFHVNPAASDRPVPAATLSYRRKCLQREQEGNIVRQRYKRKEGTICRQCGKERLKESHRQYYGHWWCQETATESADFWLENLKSQGIGKRKKKEPDSQTH